MKITSYNGNQKWVSDFMRKMDDHMNREGGITVKADAKTRQQEWVEQWREGDHAWMFLILNQEDREYLRQMKQDGKRTWSFNRESVTLELGDIFYIDSYKRKTTVYMEKKAHRIKRTCLRRNAYWRNPDLSGCITVTWFGPIRLRKSTA